MKAYVLYDTPVHAPNMYVWGHFMAHDPFWIFKIDGLVLAVVSQLEYGRCRQEGTFDAVILTDTIRQEAEQLGDKDNFVSCLFRYIQRHFGVDQWIVPDDFPAFLWKQLCGTFNLGFESDFWRNLRQIKSPQELQAIEEACSVTARALDGARDILRACEVDEAGCLVYQDQVLTSERLRSWIECFCLENGAYASDTIVAGGNQAANPHCLGYGPLHANEFIVIDLFPKSRNYYYGDMTRTFFKGQPSDHQVHYWQCVMDAQSLAMKTIKAGVSAKSIMNGVQQFFEDAGFPLRQTESGSEGFIHSLGHGLGLDLHEYPSLGNVDVLLRPRMVVTVEPGLYYKDLGGVRIEDVVCVTETGVKKLSNCSYEWIV